MLNTNSVCASQSIAELLWGQSRELEVDLPQPLPSSALMSLEPSTPQPASLKKRVDRRLGKVNTQPEIARRRFLLLATKEDGGRLEDLPRGSQFAQTCEAVTRFVGPIENTSQGPSLTRRWRTCKGGFPGGNTKCGYLKTYRYYV